MLKPFELLVWLYTYTSGGQSWVDSTDFPALLAAVYGCTGEPDEPTMLGVQYDLNALVASGWAAKHVKGENEIIVLTAAGFVQYERIANVSATDPTPVGPLG